MNTKSYAKELREVFDYQSYANLMHGIGKQCNEHKLRFDKSDFVEKSLEEMTGGRLQWVDEEGYDNIDTKYDYKLEVKYLEDALFTKKRVALKEYTRSYKIKNTYMVTDALTRVGRPAYYYLFFQQNAMAILPGTKINYYSEGDGDGITAQMPWSALGYVFTPSDVKIKNTFSINYKKEKDEMQRNIIRSFYKGVSKS